MHSNAKNWRIEDIETVAGYYGISVRKTSGSHVILTHPEWIDLLSVPAHRPIKPVYIKRFIKLVDILEEDENE